MSGGGSGGQPPSSAAPSVEARGKLGSELAAREETARGLVLGRVRLVVALLAAGAATLLLRAPPPPPPPLSRGEPSAALSSPLSPPAQRLRVTRRPYQLTSEPGSAAGRGGGGAGPSDSQRGGCQ